MKGGVRLLLIAILATAATAKYEFDSEQVQRALANINTLKIHKAKLDNEDAQVEWEFIEYSKQAVFFKVKNWKKIPEKKCEGLPALVIDDGPIHCLSRMIFKPITMKEVGKESLKFGLIIENSNDRHDWKMILSDLYKTPEKEEKSAVVLQHFIDFGDSPNILQLEPITKEQVASVRDKKSFVGSTSWIKKILGGQIHSLELKSERRSRVLYMAYPSVMNAETLDEVLALLSKNTQNGANVESSQNNNEEITNQLSVKQLVDFWNKAEKQ